MVQGYSEHLRHVMLFLYNAAMDAKEASEFIENVYPDEAPGYKTVQR